jgi:NADPH-dependent F420 reductase
MKIGIIGTGKLGSTLGKLWAEKGNTIIFGSRDSQKAKKLGKLVGFNSMGGTYEEAKKLGDIVVLAVPWSAAKEAIELAGDLKDKIVVDCTATVSPHVGGLLKGLTTSGAEKIAKWAENAKIIKTVHTIGVESLNKVEFGTQKASLFICGDDMNAKSIVKQLGTEIGFDVIDAGPLINARLIEPLAMLWVELAYNQGMGTDIAFKLLTRRKSKFS